ncbi:MAG: tRNA (cytidine(34)-2'-O)-methyltransferase [Candidatus Nucleicultricaceae bacterium]
MDIALYQPEIPQNTGTIMRICACFGVPLHIIHPSGFALNDRNLRRAGMDYISLSHITQHISQNHFLDAHQNKRVILVTPHTETLYTHFEFKSDDILLFGSESSGVPPEIHARFEHKVKIPMIPECRSFNLAVSVGIVLSEALRQTHHFPN